MKLLRDTSIGLKVAVAPATAIALMVTLGAMSWSNSRQQAANFELVGKTAINRVSTVKDLTRQVVELQLSINQSLAFEGMGQRPEVIKKIDDELRAGLAETRKAIADFKATVNDGHQSAPKLEAALAHYDEFAKGIQNMLDLKEVQLNMAGGVAKSLSESYIRLRTDFDGVALAELTDAQRLAEQSALGATRTQRLGAVLLVLAVAIAAALAALMRRLISASLNQARQQASSLQQGDLSERETAVSGDEAGQLVTDLQETAASLRQLIIQIRQAADEIHVAAAEISSGSQDLSVRTESTASSLEETAASVEQLAQTTRSSSENARAANGLAHDASEIAVDGGKAVNEVVKAMEDINSQAAQISEIIGVIDGIAFQTNILALNAAVEAARAGDQGRGFAVVAGEVRALAGRSGEAAKQIRTLIHSSVERIESGSARARLAGDATTRIIDAIARVVTTVDEVARTAAEQSAGIDQVHAAINEMDRNTQQNAAMVEEAAAAASTLKAQADQLVNELQRFKV